MSGLTGKLKWSLRQAKWLVIATLFGAIALAVIASLLDDFVIDGAAGIILASLSIAVGQAVAWPLIYRFSSWLPAVIFPLAIFATSGSIILAVSNVDDLLGVSTFHVRGFETAIWISLGMTVVMTSLSAVFSLDDREFYDRMVTRPLRTRYLADDAFESPGFLFLEIDGLARPVLEKAIALGYAPTMKRWVESGSHVLHEWEPDLSSQTSASQAGILLGNNENIPAFRWWDKREQKMMVSSSMRTAQYLESLLASDRGLLAPNGSSRFNVFSGGASDCVGTFSRLRSTDGQIAYWALFANPYTLGRLISLFVQEVLREWWEEFQQNRRNVQPRIPRAWTYAFVRAGTTAALLELTRFMCIADIYRGVPSAYYTIFAYDEVAHHTGIDREYTFRVLRKIDAMLDHLERVATTGNRQMRFVILSDHGQSQGSTFSQRFGETLGDVVTSAAPGGSGISAILDSTESIAHLRAMVLENEESHPRSSRTLARLIENQQRRRVSEPDPDAQGPPGFDVSVLASGNLGLISFVDWPERMTLQQIVNEYPLMISTLVGHPGVGFVMVDDEKEGGIVLGKSGTYFLDTDTVEGENPLTVYGSRAAQHLRRTNSFPSAPDILVVSTYWEDQDEVAAFEELVGNHGGLGGPQQRPFLLHPAEFSAGEEEIVGAATLNSVLKRWIAETQSERDLAIEPLSRS
ncbi:MAG: phage holin family protein [Thermomicrobiales bacterium]